MLSHNKLNFLIQNERVLWSFGAQNARHLLEISAVIQFSGEESQIFGSFFLRNFCPIRHHPLWWIINILFFVKRAERSHVSRERKLQRHITVSENCNEESIHRRTGKISFLTNKILRIVIFNNTHFFLYRQLDISSLPGVANEILENKPQSCLAAA